MPDENEANHEGIKERKKRYKQNDGEHTEIFGEELGKHAG